ncbi:MAG: efflux RND transporter permease subunit [Pirellulales bacterium]|nr:efflux RND transporter permease subunit [Pirellulales bacterium]
MLIRAIIDLALSHRVLVLLITALTSLAGVIAYRQMPKDIYPDLNAPLVNIITTCPGMASEEVERVITFPLESLMNGTPHVTRVRSESTTGESVVTVEFDWGIDIYRARQIIDGKLDLVAGQLPEQADTPTMGPVSSRMGEIFEFAVVGKDDGGDPMELRGIADWTIRYRLLGVKGISHVINLGGFVRQYQVFLKPDMLHHFEITVSDVKDAIERSNRNFSGGVIRKKNQEFLIKGLGRIESIKHIKDTVITSRNNVPVFVKDVADVEIGSAFPQGNAGFNGKEAVSVVVQKQYGGDTLKTIQRIKSFLRDIKKDLAETVDAVPYYDQSVLILDSLRHVEISMLEGGLLVLVVIFIFLGNLRASLIAALTIPISILFSLGLMYCAGVSLTVMALGGLAIGIGKMAGGSVIMVENIYKRLEDQQSEATVLQRVAYGAKEIGPYLFSANLIIVLVFLPLLTLEGVAGRMFRPTVFALVAALCGSLIMNITLNPVLMSLCLEQVKQGKRKNRFVAFSTRVYSTMLKQSFRHKAAVLLVGVAILAVAVACYRRLGSEFVPFLDEGSIVASTVMLPETSLDESVRVGKKVVEIFRSFPEVDSVCRTTGMAEGEEHVHPVNHSHYMIKLKPREERQRGYLELTEAMREKLDNMPGIVYIFEQPIANKMAEMLTGTEGQIALKVFGYNLDTLDAKAREIGNVISQVPGIADLQVEETTGIPLIEIHLDRESLARHGIQVDHVADLIETALNGVEVTDVIEDEKITAVLLRLPKKYRDNADTIRNLLVDTPSGHQVPLAEIAHIARNEGPQTIFRENLMRRKIILCNVVGRDLGGFVEEAKAAIARKVDLPKGYHITFGGQFESQQRTERQLMWMMLFVGLSVLIVLFASLRSFRQSLLLLLNIPMTLSGGIIALYLTGQTLNVSSLIGFIALFGIALQNGVILVGKINDLRNKGAGLHDAVIEGALNRFRPIFMTELILIIGVLPLAIGQSSGSEIHRPLAVVYIGGFVVAIFFEQILLPILYEIFSRLKEETVIG